MLPAHSPSALVATARTFAAVATALWLASNAVPAPAAAGDLRVLFIGNSLTAANDLPSLVRRIGEADRAGISTATVAISDFGLAEHLQDGRALREIRRGGWNVVVLQQGPSALPESRAILREQAAKFAPLIREAGARPALYMVWPSRQRQGDFERVVESYRIAAADIDAVLLPVGRAWRAAWKQAPEARLYSGDGFHPSQDGSWLAALVIYCGVTGRSPSALARFPAGFPSRRLFVHAADEALRGVH